MLGINKEDLIEIIQKADVEIFTDMDMEDIFIDSGKECHYNLNGEVVYDN